MGPGGRPERRLVPDLPVLGGRHDVDVEVDADVLELVAPDLADGLVPGAVGVADVDRDLDAVRIAGVGQQLLGALDVAHERRQLEVLGMDRRHVVVLADVAAALEHQVAVDVVVGRHDQRLAQLHVVERRLADLEAAAERLRGPRLDDLALERLGELVLLDAERVDGVDVARGERGQLVVGVVVVVVDLVEVDVAAPVFEVLAVGRLGDPLEDATVADRELGQRERPGADRVVRERRLERRVQDRGRIVVAVLRAPTAPASTG